MHIAEPGDYGKGLQVLPGDKLAMPTGSLKFSFNPLKSSGQFSRYGLDWFAKRVFIDNLIAQEGNFEVEIAKLDSMFDEIVNESPIVKPLNVNNPDDGEKIFKLLLEHQDKKEFWAMLAGWFLAMAREARGEQNILRASWATACAERCRMMLIFKEHLEEVVWMGQSARRLLDALNTWAANRENHYEEFWQLTFSEHSYVLSQVFAVPVAL